MTQETIERLHCLEERQSTWEKFINVLREKRMLAAYELNRGVPCGACSIDDYFTNNPYSLFPISSADEGEFIDHVLTCAEERLSQIKKAIEEL